MKTNTFIMTAHGVKMPKLIYGTAWKEGRTAGLVENALTLGFRGIDTACQPKHYNETGVGQGIAACLSRGLLTRPELYLQTKFTPLGGQDPNRIPYDPKADLGAQVKQSCQVSLDNLQATYLDCLVLHSPLPSQQQTHEAWQAMEGLVQDGVVKQLGISNCYDVKALESLYNFAEVKPAVIQNRFYDKTGYDLAIRDFCKRYGVIYQGFWTLTANPKVLGNPKLQNLAVNYRKSPAQVFFRYLTQVDIVPLTGTASESHMQEDLAIFSFELDAQACAEIDALLRDLI